MNGNLRREIHSMLEIQSFRSKLIKQLLIIKPLKRVFWPKLSTKELSLYQLEIQLLSSPERKKTFKNSKTLLWKKKALPHLNKDQLPHRLPEFNKHQHLNQKHNKLKHQHKQLHLQVLVCLQALLRK